MTDVPPPYLKAIYDFLFNAFSRSELYSLFYLAQDADLRNARHEYLETESKPSQIRKALDYCERHHLFDELLEEIERTRPGEFLQLPEVRTSVLQPDQLEKLLKRGSQVPEAREAVARAKVRLADKCRQIQWMSECKDAHDALQVVEGSYRALHDQLYNDIGQLGPLGSREWRISASSRGALQTNIIKLLESVQGKSFGATVDERLESLRTSHDDLLLAYNRKDETLLDDTLYEIDHVIGTTTSRINDFLISAIKELHLSDLTRELQSVYESVKEYGAEATARDLEDDEKAIARLDRMSERLERRQEEHDAWQDLDNRLRNEQKQMEAGPNVRGLRRSWTRKLREDMIALCEPVQPGCSQNPDSEINRLDAALGRTPVDHDEVVAAFFECRSMATNHFVRVDRRLQRLCEALAKAGDWWRTALERV
mgnify:CR=1 FL=1